MRKMINYSPLGDAQTEYMNVLQTIDELDNWLTPNVVSYSIDMEILTDYFQLLIRIIK